MSTAEKAVPKPFPIERVPELLVTRVRVGLCGSKKFIDRDGECHYWAEAFKSDGRFFYHAKGVTIEIPEYRYHNVIANPYLYYFSSALSLHYQILGELKKQGVRCDRPAI